MESWEDFVPPVEMDTDSSFIRGREVSLGSSDRWNDDDSILDVKHHMDEVVTVQWDVPYHDHAVMDEDSMRSADGALVNFTSNGDIMLGVSVPDNNHEPYEDNGEPNSESRPAIAISSGSALQDVDDDNYIEELYFQAYTETEQMLASSISPELQSSFRKRRADLAACMEATRKTRRVLHEHMKQRGSLARVLADIEQSSLHIQMLIRPDTNL